MRRRVECWSEGAYQLPVGGSLGQGRAGQLGAGTRSPLGPRAVAAGEAAPPGQEPTGAGPWYHGCTLRGRCSVWLVALNKHVAGLRLFPASIKHRQTASIPSGGGQGTGGAVAWTAYGPGGADRGRQNPALRPAPPRLRGAIGGNAQALSPPRAV